MTLIEDRMANAAPKIKAIVELISDELRVYPGDEAMRLISKLLDIIDEVPSASQGDIRAVIGR